MRSRLALPTYRRHLRTGRAVVSVYKADGSRTEVLLPGKFGSKESKNEYELLLAKLRTGEGQLPTEQQTDLTVAEWSCGSCVTPTRITLTHSLMSRRARLQRYRQRSVRWFASLETRRPDPLVRSPSRR